MATVATRQVQLPSSPPLLLSAGHETATGLIGNGGLARLRFPGEIVRLRERADLFLNAIEEFILTKKLFYIRTCAAVGRSIES